MALLVIHAHELHHVASSPDHADRAALKAWVRDCVAQSGGWVRHFSARIGLDEETVQQLLDPTHAAYPTPALVECIERAWRLRVPDGVRAAAKRQKFFEPTPAPCAARPTSGQRSARFARISTARFDAKLRERADRVKATQRRRLRPEAVDECFTLSAFPDAIFRSQGILTFPARDVPALQGGSYTLPDGHRAALIDHGEVVQLVNLGSALTLEVRRVMRCADGHVDLRFDNRRKTLTFACGRSATA